MREQGIRLREIVENATKYLQKQLNFQSLKVIAASEIENGWYVSLQVVSTRDTEKSLPTYRVFLDENGQATRYEQEVRIKG